MRKILFGLACGLFLLAAQSTPVGAFYCPLNFCAQLRQECQQDCAPCQGIAACYAYVCDGICSCSC
jgi:hypothetical protein